MLQEFIDEIEILNTIYEEKISVLETDKEYQVLFLDKLFNLKFFIPFQYPNLKNYESIHFNIISFNSLSSKKLEEKAYEILKTIEPQEPIFFSILSELILLSNEYEDIIEDNIIEQINEIINEEDIEQSKENKVENDSELKIIHGPTFIVQKSIFQSHLTEVSSLKQVNLFIQSIKTNKKYAKATHNILAFRFFDTTSQTIYADCDDDGETSAAGRLLEMMRLMGSIGVAVIVSRWFGGILLGPDRFKYINNSARALLEEYDYCDEKKRSKKKLFK